MYNKVFEKASEEVLTLFEMSDDELFSNNRKRKFANARHMLLHMLNDLGIPVMELQVMMSDKTGYEMNHGVICNAIRSSKVKMESDTIYRKSFNSLLLKIKNGI